MSAIINTNIASLGAQTQLDKSRAVQTQAIQRLSSGLRINGAADDAAGLAISQRMTTQLRGLNVAARNAQDAISLSQTAEGSLGSISDNLQRMRELAVQAANSTNTASDRAALQQEVSQLLQETDRVARQANYNGQSLLDGSFTAQQFQVGADAGQTITFAGIASARTNNLGQYTGSPGAPVTTTSAGTIVDPAAYLNGPGQLIINGVDVFPGSNPYLHGADVLAAAINNSGVAGLTATATPNVLVGSWAPSGSNYQMLTFAHGSNTYSFDVALVGDRSTDIAATLAGLASAGIPGLIAVDNGNGITLSTADGSDIGLSFNPFWGPIHPEAVGLAGIAHGVSGGLDPVATSSNVTISYTGTTGLSIGGTKAAAFGFTPILPQPSAVGTTLADVDVSTISGANVAIQSIDSAIDAVNGQRSALGALQNRFDAAVRNIDTAAANTAAARSRITDADFAAETAQLASANVLQQAGAAIVAQANALPDSVLILLRA